MKGLFLKDIYNVKFQLICGLAIMLYPNIIMVMGGSEITEQGGLFGVICYGLVNYMSITLCSSFMLNTISDDYRTGWAKMQRTMPLSAQQIVGAKMLTIAFIIGMLMAISLVFNLVGTIIAGLPIEPMITIPFVVALLQMITLSVAVVLGYKSEARYITPLYIGMVVLIAALITVLLFGLFNETISMTSFRIVIYAGIPVIAAAVVTICCKMSRKAVEGDI